MKANIEFRQARNFGEIISDCIIFIKQNWKSLLKTYFVFCGFFMAGILIFGLLERVRMVNQNTAAMAGRYENYSIYGLDYFMVLLFSFMNIISAILSTVSYIALYAQNKHAPSISDVWSYYKYYFWRIIGHFLLLFVIFIVAVFIVALPFTMITQGMQGATNPFVIGIIVLVCMLTPLIYFITVLSLFFPTVIIENGGFGYAFSKCFKLVKKRWWNTFGVVLVSVIIFYAGFLLIVVPFSVLTGANITFIPYTVSFPIVFLYKLLMSVYQVFNIFPIIASAITYFSYTEEKENVGLLERIETLGVTSGNIESDNEAY